MKVVDSAAMNGFLSDQLQAQQEGNGVAPELHRPVMLEEVVQALAPRSGGTYVDLTLGLGGHARRILEASAPAGRLVGLDRDPEALRLAERNLAEFGSRVTLLHGRFSQALDLLRAEGLDEVDGLLADLGVSSLQLTYARRGFSFDRPGPLDMRMDPAHGSTLDEFLAATDENELGDVLRRFGDVDHARTIARRILHARGEGRLQTTADLARVAAETSRRGRSRIHPATRVFQALRMWVNSEVSELEALLGFLPEPLRVGGRVALIAFHSVEDRLIKERYRDLAGRCTCPRGVPRCGCGARPVFRLLTRKAQRTSPIESAHNPRARSASLRVAERLAA